MPRTWIRLREYEKAKDLKNEMKAMKEQLSTAPYRLSSWRAPQTDISLLCMIKVNVSYSIAFTFCANLR